MAWLLIALSICLFDYTVHGEVVNGVDVEQACRQNEALARAYCRSTEDEPPAVKPKCDLYRKYCSDITPTSAPASPQCRQIAYCGQYASQNKLICANAAFANGSSDRQRFCANYKAMCAKVPADPDNECGLNKNGATTPVRPIPNAFNGPPPSPALNRLTDLNGGGPLATVGQSSIDNIQENMAQSAANAPLFGILGKLAGMGAKTAGSAAGQAAGGNIADIGSALYSGSGDGGDNFGPQNPTGPALGIQTIPGFEPQAQNGPFGTKPLWIGNNIGVGPFANAGRSAQVNPFGKVGWGNQWGAMGFSGYRGGGVDFGSVPGLTDLNNPLVGGKRKRRDLLKSVRVNSFYRFLYN